jgi:hypothetical protein
MVIKTGREPLKVGYVKEPGLFEQKRKPRYLALNVGLTDTQIFTKFLP